MAARPRTLVVDCYLRDGEQKLGRYLELAGRHSVQVRTVKAGEVGPEFDLGSYDAVILSGSQWMLSEAEPPAALVGFCQVITLPTLGICFGHQLLCRSFGAVVVSGERFLEFDEHVEFLADWPLFTGLGPAATMRESHREFVTPESLQSIGWEIGARSSSCPVEAARHPQLPLYGVQFHPERSGPTGEQLFANFFSRIVRRA